MQTVEITFTVPIILDDEIAEKLKLLVQSSVLRPEEPASWLKMQIINLAHRLLPMQILAHFERHRLYGRLLDEKTAI
jgi:hypothetical protein